MQQVFDKKEKKPQLNTGPTLSEEPYASNNQ